MANTVITKPSVYPEGTVVKAYTVAAEPHADNGTAPDNLSSVETKTVTSGSLTFTGLTAGQRYVLHALVSDALVTRSTVGDGTHDEVDVVAIRGVNGRALSAGTFTLTVNVDGGGAQTTAAIPYDASAADVQLALEALSNLAPGDVTVSGGRGGPWTLTFGGAATHTSIVVTVDPTNVVGATERRFLRISGSA